MGVLCKLTYVNCFNFGGGYTKTQYEILIDCLYVPKYEKIWEICQKFYRYVSISRGNVKQKIGLYCAFLYVCLQVYIYPYVYFYTHIACMFV